jgi:myo-inositol-hexaphosphate 3-phosphohydrolase
MGSRVMGSRVLARTTVRTRALLAVALAITAVATGTVGLPAAHAAVVTVCPTAETTPVHNSGDAADDSAIWVHPSDTSQSTVVGTDKSTAGGLNVYDLSGKELYFKNDGRLNNDDVRYNFPLGPARVALVGATNREAKTLDFYRVNTADRALTKVGSVPIASGSKITTPRGFAFYHSPASGKYYAFVTDVGHTEQYELDGSTGQVTGTRVRVLADTPVLHTEGLVADDELGRLYLAEEDIGGIWRFGAEPNDPVTGVKIATTTEAGGHIVQDVKGLTMYFASGGRGYLIAVSQGGDSFHLFDRGNNAWVGEFKVGSCNGIDAVTGIDGADVTNVNLGTGFAQGMFVTQDTSNDTGNQNHKLVPWQNIANAFSPPLVIDTSWDPRTIGATAPAGPETVIDSGPSGTVTSSGANFGFSSNVAGATFGCSLDGSAFTGCTSPRTYQELADGAHTFQVRATDTSGTTDPTPASRTWTIDTTETTPPPPPPPPATGAVIRESSSTVVNSTATATVTVPTPTGTVAGDVLVACLAVNGGTVTSSGVPTGWRPLASVTAISNPHVFGYYKVVAGTEPASSTWTMSGAVLNGAGIARYSGVDTSSPLAATTSTATGASATSAVLPGITTQADNAMLVGCLGVNSSSTGVTLTSPTGMTQAWDIGGKRHELADSTQPTAGPTGAKTWTLSSARESAGWLTALRPAP